MRPRTTDAAALARVGRHPSFATMVMSGVPIGMSRADFMARIQREAALGDRAARGMLAALANATHTHGRPPIVIEPAARRRSARAGAIQRAAGEPGPAKAQRPDPLAAQITANGGVAYLALIGPIVEGQSGAGTTGPVTFRRDVDALIAAGARAAVLTVNSSGGIIPAALEMRSALTDLRRSGCRVVAWMTNAHSAAYLVALAADRLVLSERGSVLIHAPTGAAAGACYAAAAEIGAILDSETLLGTGAAAGMTSPTAGTDWRFGAWEAASRHLVDDVGGEAEVWTLARAFAERAPVPPSDRQVALNVRRQQKEFSHA
jgi:hypothetical protein